MEIKVRYEKSYALHVDFGDWMNNSWFFMKSRGMKQSLVKSSSPICNYVGYLEAVEWPCFEEDSLACAKT